MTRVDLGSDPTQERDVKKRLVWLVAVVSFAGALAFGMITMTPLEASAAPCGLSITGEETVQVDDAEVTFVTYTIRNCHDYPVERELDVARFWDWGECHQIPAGRTVSGLHSIPDFAEIRGIRPC